MKTKEAITLFQTYQRSSHRKRTLQSYLPMLSQFKALYGETVFENLGSDEIYRFLEDVTQGRARSTRRLRYAQLKAVFNFVINRCDLDMKNPCNTSLLSKTFRTPKQSPRRIFEKEAIDEIIYNTKNLRDRLILELQARCGLRVGESLKIRVSDISERKIILREPKSGKEAEVAYMPEPIAKRLEEYVRTQNLGPDDRLFRVSYSTVRSLIKSLGSQLNISIRPHDLRRHSATYASRNGVPLEIVSKVILRHQDLKTTQAYLGRVSETEAIRWMDIIHGK
jgi:integrase/recombinase XerD